MKTFPAGLSSMLASGLTTLCHCWLLERADGLVFGFTDHDRTLSFGGVDYAPETGFTASEAERSLGLSVDTMELSGALSSDAITEGDIALGLWDAAAITVFVVDWSNVANRAILLKGSLGELERGEHAAMAEVRSLAHALNQEQGRTYTRICDAVLGDARCGVDLTSGTYKGTGAVLSAIDDRILIVSGLGGYADGWFSRGVLTWTGGGNEGLSSEVRAHSRDAAGIVRIVLRQAAGAAVWASDAFVVTAGCDKTWPTCRAKFANGVNYRGFPHIPGNDFALGVAHSDQVNDGGSFYA